MTASDATLLSLYINASRRRGGKPLYRAAVETAHARRAAGASVFLVDLSYGAHQRLRDAKSEYLSVDIPVVVEVVDAPDRADALAAELVATGLDGLTTLEPVRIVHFERLETDGAAGAVAETVVPEPAGGHAMPLEGDVQKVTVYVGSSDTWHGRNLAAAIVERCRRAGMAGATASLGVMGFGRRSVIHRPHPFGLSEDVPEKVEVVDRPDRIAAILPALGEMVQDGLIVVQDVRAVRRGGRTAAAEG